MIVHKDTAFNLPFYLVEDPDDTGNPYYDNITGATVGSFTIKIGKNGGSMAAVTRTVTEMGEGWYSIAFTSADTDTAGELVITVDYASAARWTERITISAGVPIDVSSFLAQYLTADAEALLSHADASAIDTTKMQLIDMLAFLSGVITTTGTLRTAKTVGGTSLRSVNLETGTGLTDPVIGQSQPV